MDVERWDTCEIALDAAGSYPNPFTDVGVDATFTHESSGKSIAVGGFFDGGSVWRIRFMPTEPGTWQYVTRSQDPGLDGQSGVVTCVPPLKPYLHGPLLTDGHHFRHADGTRRLPISTRFSCQFASPSVWIRLIKFLKEHRINRVLFIMGGIHGTVRELYGPGPDFSRYNLVRFQAIDAFIDALRKADILASPYLYYFNDGEQHKMSPKQDRAYVRYGMARFGAYSNVMPVLCNQVEGKYTWAHEIQYNLASHLWANEMGRYLAEQSVFGLPVTVHNPYETDVATRPSYYTLLKDWPFPWADLMLRQIQVSALGAASELSDTMPEQKTPTYNARGYARHNQLLVDLRRFGVPVINEEPGYEMDGLTRTNVLRPEAWNTQTSDTLIPTFWTAITAGAYFVWGHPAVYDMDDPFESMRSRKTPEYIRVLHDFVASLPYWEMAPANEVVSANEVAIDGVGYRTNVCLAKPGEVYLVLSLEGGSLSITLGTPGKDGDEGSYEVIQLDPRQGNQTKLGRVESGCQEIRLSGKEQVLLFRRC